MEKDILNIVPQENDDINLQPEIPEFRSAFDPFSVTKPTSTLCDRFFSNCKEISKETISNPTNIYLQRRSPMAIEAKNSSVRFWPALYWNYWHWSNKRYTTLNKVAELPRQSSDEFLSKVFGAAEFYSIRC